MSSNNLRLSEELDTEIQRRNQMEDVNRKSMMELSESLRKSQHQERGDKVIDSPDGNKEFVCNCQVLTGSQSD